MFFLSNHIAAQYRQEYSKAQNRTYRSVFLIPHSARAVVIPAKKRRAYRIKNPHDFIPTASAGGKPYSRACMNLPIFSVSFLLYPSLTEVQYLPPHQQVISEPHLMLFSLIHENRSNK